MRLWTASLVIATIIGLRVGIAHAEDTGDAATSPTALQTAIKAMGCAEALSPSAPIAKLTVTCDEQEVLRQIPMLQGIGLINGDLKQADLNARPVTITGAVVLQAVDLALPLTYRTTAVDRIRVSAVVTVIDDYGHDVDHEMMSFSFDRSLYTRIDWLNFDPSKLPKVSKNFIFSRWEMISVAREREGDN